MIIFFDKNGTLKEIIGERPFRSGDSQRDKIYIYWDGEHSINTGWVKFLKANNEYYEYEPTVIEKQFFTSGDNLVPVELPTEPLRNLEYFSYEHTYIGSDNLNHIGYLCYEIEVPDGVLASAISTNKVCVCSVRFVMADSSIEQLGVMPFSVDATTGIIPDNSINETQYNYLIKLISDKQDKIIWNVGGLLEETLTSLRADGKSYGIEAGGSTGTTNYNDLTNKPKINNVELGGNKSLNDLGIVSLLGNEAGSGQPYNFPYNIRDLRYENSRIKGNLDTITLDNNKTLHTYPLEVAIPNLADTPNNKKYGLSLEVKSDGKCHLLAEEI